MIRYKKIINQLFKNIECHKFQFPEILFIRCNETFGLDPLLNNLDFDIFKYISNLTLTNITDNQPKRLGFCFNQVEFFYNDEVFI